MSGLTHSNHGGQHWSAQCPACCPGGVLRMPIMRCGLFVPFDLMHAPTAMENHGQTLTRLAQRGGLSATEAWAVIEARSWRKGDEAQAVAKLREWLASLGVRQ